MKRNMKHCVEQDLTSPESNNSRIRRVTQYLLMFLVLAIATCQRSETETLGPAFRRQWQAVVMNDPHELSGTVFGGGAPMPGALVEALTDGTTTLVASNTTDASGRYALALDKSTYDLRVIPSAQSGFDIQTVQNVVMDSINKRHDIVLIEEGGVVQGTVRGYGGVGLGGVNVYVYDASNGKNITEAVTDSEGVYRFNLGAGEFYFHLQKDASNSPEMAPNGLWHCNSVANKIEGTTTLNFNLPVAKVSGQVKSNAGPVQRATIWSSGAYSPKPCTETEQCSGSKDFTWLRYSSSFTTNNDGNYELFVFTGHANSLAVSAPKPLATIAERNLLIGSDLNRDFTLTDSIVTGHVYGAEIQPGMGSAPAPGVTVQLLDRFDNNFSVVIDSTITDENGFYQFNLVPDDYVLKLSSENSTVASAPNGAWEVYLNNQATATDSNGMSTLDIPLPVAKVTGIVTDSSSERNPLSNVCVVSSGLKYSSEASRTYYNSTTHTDSSGNYYLVVFTGPSDSFTVTPSSSLPRLIETMVSVTGDIKKDFMIPAVGVTGTVLGYGGTPIPGVTIGVLDRFSWVPLHSVKTDNSGNYKLDLGPGNYLIRLIQNSSPGAAPKFNWSTVLHDQEISETFNFTIPIAKVNGVVTDSIGASVANIRVSAAGSNSTSNDSSNFQGDTFTQSNGRYELLVFKGTNQTFTITPDPASGFSMTVLSNVNVSEDFSQSVVLNTVDSSPPILVAAPKVIHLSDTSVSINWETNEPANSWVDYGVTALSSSKGNDTMVLLHEVTFMDLSPSTVYQYQVHSTDKKGNGPISSAVLTFRTQAPPGDITAPVIVRGPTISSIGQSSAIVTWTTDEPASSEIDYGISSDQLLMHDKLNGQYTIEHQMLLSNLSPLTTYYFAVKSMDPDGNGPTTNPVAAFTTLELPDSQAPVCMDGPRMLEATQTTLTVVWTTNEAATSGVSANDGTAYTVVNDPTLVTSHRMVLADLKPSTNYQITVSSKDLVGNGPTLCGPIVATTLAIQTNLPPTMTVPADRVAEATWPTGAVVTFTASATDPEDGQLAALCSPAAGSTFALGATTVTCTATDSQGASVSKSFKVTVVDTIAPKFTLVPPTLTISNCSSVKLDPAVATDSVSAVTVTNNAPSVFVDGPNLITWTAKDASGNSATATQTVVGTCLTCVFARQGLNIKDRSQVSGASVGTAQLFIGPSGKVTGDAKSSGNADLQSNVKITGTLKVAGKLTRAPGVVIGTLIHPATVPTLALPVKSIQAGSGSTSIAPGVTKTLAPGQYGKMTISSRAKVTLKAGTYDFASLTIEPSVKLILDTSGGSITINSQGALAFKSQITYTFTDPLKITWYSNTSISLEPQQLPEFPGNLESPNGNLRIGSNTKVHGCVQGGKIVDIDVDSTITGHPL